MALGLTLGIILAVSSGSTTKIAQTAGVASASPSAGASSAGASASPSVTPSGTAAAAAAPASTGAAANAADFAIPPVNPAGQAGVAGANAVDAAGNPFSFNQDAAQAATSMNCTISVPANPLSAQGLATPWQLGDGCSWAHGATEGAFVEATILAPNGKVQIYDPLVVTQGMQPAVAPAPPRITGGSQIIISLGFNGNALALVGPGATQANCVDALGNSLIDQTPQCNAANFYQLANAEIARGTLNVPAAGTAKDGKACPTTHDFSVIDQDQSDNVVARYLFDPNTGATAQATAANVGNMAHAVTQTNGSDEGLIAGFVDPALGCAPWMAPNTTNPKGMSASQALNELMARHDQQRPVALLPVNDPQLLVGGQFSVAKTNLYRQQTDQAPLSFRTTAQQNAARYCQNMVNIQAPRLKLDATLEAGTASPVPALGNNLANFLAARLSGSFGNLNCGNFGLTDPVMLTTDAAGVATGATFNTAQQAATVTATNTGANA